MPARPAIGPYTVRDAVADYLDWFKATGKKSIKETEASVGAFILPQLGDAEVGVTNLSIKLHALHPPAPAACRQRPSAAAVSLRRNRTARPLQSVIFSPALTQGVDNHLQTRFPGHQLIDPGFEAPRADNPHLEPEIAQRPAQ